MQLGKTIMQLRVQRNWEQKDLAKALGVSIAQINRIENCKRNPSKDLIEKICVVFGKTLSEIMYSQLSVPKGRRKKTLDLIIAPTIDNILNNK